MHNLMLGIASLLGGLRVLMYICLLGVVKNQWYSQWIKNSAIRASTSKTARELDIIQDFLSTVRSMIYLCSLLTYVVTF